MLLSSDQGETEVPGNETAYTFLDATPYTEYFVCVAITKDAEGGVCCDHTTAEDGENLSVSGAGFALVSVLFHCVGMEWPIHI